MVTNYQKMGLQRYINVDKELSKYFLVRAYELIIIHNSKALTKKYFDNYFSR